MAKVENSHHDYPITLCHMYAFVSCSTAFFRSFDCLIILYQLILSILLYNRRSSRCVHRRREERYLRNATNGRQDLSGTTIPLISIIRIISLLLLFACLHIIYLYLYLYISISIHQVTDTRTAKCGLHQLSQTIHTSSRYIVANWPTLWWVGYHYWIDAASNNSPGCVKRYNLRWVDRTAYIVYNGPSILVL